MQMFNGILGGMGGRVFEQAAGSENGERDTFTENRFTSWTGSSLVADQFSDLAVFVVPAQTAYTWGFGEPRPGKSDNQGRWYADLASSTPNNAIGRLRLYSRKSTGKAPDDHGTRHTSELRQNLSDRTTWPFLPEANMPKVGEDSELVLRFELDSASSTDSDVDQTESTIRISVTEFS